MYLALWWGRGVAGRVLGVQDAPARGAWHWGGRENAAAGTGQGGAVRELTILTFLAKSGKTMHKVKDQSAKRGRGRAAGGAGAAGGAVSHSKKARASSASGPAHIPAAIS